MLKIKVSNINLVFVKKINIINVKLIISFNNFIIYKVVLMIF